MNATRLKWIVLMVAFFLSIRFVSGYRSRTVHEYATSAQLYLHLPRQANSGLPGGPSADQAIVTVTTAAEVRNESVAAMAIRKLEELANLTPTKPELRVGAAHVYTLQNGRWDSQKLAPGESPKTFALWPFNGKLYTWDETQSGSQTVSEWQNGKLTAPPPTRAAELRAAFPHDPANYLPAGAAQPYDIVQDAITREEWHGYQNLATLANGKQLAFPVGGKTVQLIITRDLNGELSLAALGGGHWTPLWQAEKAPHTVSRSELIAYLAAQPLSPLAPRERINRFWMDLGGSLVAIFLVWAVFLRPLLLTSVPASIQFVDADENEFPKLDRVRWNDYSERLAALGFVHVRDFKLANTLHGGISRLYLHPETHCYGNIFQVFAPNAPGLLFGFISYLGEDWTVGHGVTKPMPGSIVNRLKHTVSFARPGSSLENLYHEHVTKRDEISAGLGLAVVAPQGFDTYQQRTDMDTQARRAVIKHNPVLLAARVYLAKLRPLSNDWWGDYPKELQARTGQKFVPSEA